MARFSLTKFCIFSLICLLIVTTWRLFSCTQDQIVAGTEREARAKKDAEDEKNRVNPVIDKSWANKTLAVVIPFRDRFEELQEFVPHIHKFLNKQKIPHRVYVVNQVDQFRFNRAALINIGFLYSQDECDYIVMHDVDLLPQNLDLLYDYPHKGPYHLASPEYHPLYHYKNYIGGVLMMTNDHFKLCNGMSNLFWGWGREDDELYVRFRKHDLKLHRPTGLTSGYDTFRHIHDRRQRPRDYDRTDYREKMRIRDGGRTGVSNVGYELLARRSITIDQYPLTMLNVALRCETDEEKRWCMKPSTQKAAPKAAAPAVKNKT